ncbi:MAG: hypothetical protein ACTS8R_05500 [Arsenophonus sp. NC-QC1-MAG3]
MSDKILKEFNAESVSRFIEIIIDKESIFCSNKTKLYEPLLNKQKINHHYLNKVG